MIGFLRVNVLAFYNVTCRGNEQQAVFRDDADRVSFLSQLADSFENYHVTLHVVLLMDDHFHLVTAGCWLGRLLEKQRHLLPACSISASGLRFKI